MGVTLSGTTFVYGVNMSVVQNTQQPESVLKKKSNSIIYHAVRESADNVARYNNFIVTPLFYFLTFFYYNYFYSIFSLKFARYNNYFIVTCDFLVSLYFSIIIYLFISLIGEIQ
jgi:hypothetical protein